MPDPVVRALLAEVILATLKRGVTPDDIREIVADTLAEYEGE